MSFMVKNEHMPDKYNEIWDKVKNKLNIKFHSTPVYDGKYENIVREFESVIKTDFLGDEVPKENKHYTCIACITIDSVMGIKKKISAGLFRGMQIQNKKDKNVEAELKSESESELESNTELKAKLESASDSR